MRQALFRLAASSSFALFVATCALWCRSYTARDEREFVPGLLYPQRYFVLSQSGGVVVKHTPEWPMGAASDGETPWDSCRVTETWDRPFPKQNWCCRLGRFRTISGDDEFFEGGGFTLVRPGVAVSFPHAALVVHRSSFESLSGVS